MEDDRKSQWMSIGDASKFLGISRDTLRRWEKAGRIKPVRSPSNRRYYTKKQLEAIMSGQKTGEAVKVTKKRSLNKKSQIVLGGVASFIVAVVIGLVILFFLL